MAGTAYKIISAVIIVCLVLALMVVTSEYLKLKREKDHFQELAFLNPTIIVDSYVNDRDCKYCEGKYVRTSIWVTNKGGTGIITIEYYGCDGFSETREYFVARGGGDVFSEYWIVPPDCYVEYRIVRQEKYIDYRNRTS